jgi:hypothetical protein
MRKIHMVAICALIRKKQWQAASLSHKIREGVYVVVQSLDFPLMLPLQTVGVTGDTFHHAHSLLFRILKLIAQLLVVGLKTLYHALCLR